MRHMTNYSRMKTPGGTFFFTLALADRSASTLVDHVQALREAFRETRRERPFHTDAFVVLPDHLHAVWTLPAGDADYSTRWAAVKSRFTRKVRGRMGLNPILRSPSKIKKGDAGLWQRRFWEHTIRDEADYRQHLHYCWATR